MTQTGKVIARKGTTVEVEVLRRSACDGCRQKKYCVGGTCESPDGGAHQAKPLRTTAFDPLGAAVGDTVELSSPDRFVLGTAFLLFVLPLCTAIAAGAAAYTLGSSEGGVYGCAAAGFALPFFAVLFGMNRRAARKQFVTVTAISKKASMPHDMDSASENQADDPPTVIGPSNQK